jgi:hypothetical protein
MSAEAVAQITSMGFSEAEARQTLSATGGSVEASVNWLFGDLFLPLVFPKVTHTVLVFRLFEHLAASSASSGRNEMSVPDCRDFASGTCKYGVGCRFSHATAPAQHPGASASAEGPVQAAGRLDGMRVPRRSHVRRNFKGLRHRDDGVVRSGHCRWHNIA